MQISCVIAVFGRVFDTNPFRVLHEAGVSARHFLVKEVQPLQA